MDASASGGLRNEIWDIEVVLPIHPSSDVALQATSGLFGVSRYVYQSPVESIDGLANPHY